MKIKEKTVVTIFSPFFFLVAAFLSYKVLSKYSLTPSDFVTLFFAVYALSIALNAIMMYQHRKMFSIYRQEEYVDVPLGWFKDKNPITIIAEISVIIAVLIAIIEFVLKHF